MSYSDTTITPYLQQGALIQKNIFVLTMIGTFFLKAQTDYCPAERSTIASFDTVSFGDGSGPE